MEIGQLSTNFDIIAQLGYDYKRYRKALHLSQKQVHDKTGVSLFTISAFENGKGQGMSLAHFMLLLEVLGLQGSMQEIIPKLYDIDPEKLWKNR